MGATRRAFPGTSPVAMRHRFDVRTLEAWLSVHLDGFVGPLDVMQFASGQSNPTFLLLARSGEYVMRKKPPGELLPSAHAIDREYRAIRALAGRGVPVPTARCYCDDPSIIGTPFYLMDYQPGRIFVDPRLPNLAPAERSAVYDSMNAVLARLHAIRWQTVGLADYGKSERFIERQLARWSKQYETSQTDQVPAMERLRDWLVTHIPDDELTSVVHGDYRLGNLIYDENSCMVVAVLDWELSTIGHPFSDLAYNCMTYHLPAGHPISPGFVGADLEVLGIPSEEAYLADYAERSGLDPRPHWQFYMAFSLFRAAAIQQGVYARSLKGNAASTTAYLFGESYQLVAESGLRLT